MSDFYARKIRTCFQRHDADKDGAITQKDFEDIAARFIVSGNLDDVKAAELRAKLIKVWETYFKDPNSSTPLNEAGCIALFKKQLSDPALRDNLRNTAKDVIKIYFNAVDANDDGKIQLDEYEIFFENMAIDKTLAPASFHAIDTDNDGEISLEEFVAAGEEFFLGENESSAAKFFWGPLV